MAFGTRVLELMPDSSCYSRYSCIVPRGASCYSRYSCIVPRGASCYSRYSCILPRGATLLFAEQDNMHDAFLPLFSQWRHQQSDPYPCQSQSHHVLKRRRLFHGVRHSWLNFRKLKSPGATKMHNSDLDIDTGIYVCPTVTMPLTQTQAMHITIV